MKDKLRNLLIGTTYTLLVLIAGIIIGMRYTC